MRIDHVGLNVADLATSIAFYRDLFAFQVIAQWDSPRQAFIGNDATTIGLIELPGYDFRAYTMAHLAFPCSQSEFPDVVAKVQRLELDVVSGPKEQRGGQTILFRDPSGNILEVCYPSIAEWKAAQRGGDPTL
ncbi:MAG: VOC family protein [Candidatus Methylumidiphilus sp.]